MYAASSVRVSSFLPPPLEVSRRRPRARGRRPRPVPTPRPRARARAARRAARARRRPLPVERLDPLQPRDSTASPRLVAHRSPSSIASQPPRPCTDRSRKRVTCLCQLCAKERDVLRGAPTRRAPSPAAAAARAASRPASGRARARLPCIERLDERAADRVARRAPDVLGPQRLEQLGALLRLLAEQHGGPHRRRPGAVAAAEQRGERVVQLAGPERLVGEERQLPAVERLGELAVVVGERAAARGARRRARPRSASSRIASPCGCVAAIGSSGAIRSGRKSSRSKTTGPGGDRAGGREPQRADRVGELARGVRRLGLGRRRARARARARTGGRRRGRTRAASARAPRARATRPRLRPPRARGCRRRARRSRRPRARRAARCAAYERAVPNSDSSISAYARVEGVVAASRTRRSARRPRRAAAAGSCGRARRPAVEPTPECACAKIAAAGSRRRSSIAFRASGSRRSDGACSSRKPRTSGRYSYSDGPPRVGCSSKANGSSAPRSTANAARQKPRSDW